MTPHTFGGLRRGMDKSSSYYLNFLNQSRDEFIKNIKEGQKYDKEFYEYLTLYRKKLVEMNRYGIDDINLANCTDHKTLIIKNHMIIVEF